MELGPIKLQADFRAKIRVLDIRKSFLLRRTIVTIEYTFPHGAVVTKELSTKDVWFVTTTLRGDYP